MELQFNDQKNKIISDLGSKKIYGNIIIINYK